MKQRSVQVEIAGQRLAIRSDEGTAYVQELAEYVDAQIRELAARSRGSFNLQRVALLVAIQLADELFREKDLHSRFRERVERRLVELRAAMADHGQRLAASATSEAEAAERAHAGDAAAPSAER
jgi:cell division protein ZapA